MSPFCLIHLRLAMVHKSHSFETTSAPQAGRARYARCPGCGPLTAAIVIGQPAGAERFKSDAHFARLAGVAPAPVSSGRHDRHRLDRQINRALPVVAITRGGLDPGPWTRAYLQRKEAEGKTRMEAMRCLKRHVARRYYRLLSDRSRHRIEHQVYPGVP